MSAASFHWYSPESPRLFGPFETEREAIGDASQTLDPGSEFKVLRRAGHGGVTTLHRLPPRAKSYLLDLAVVVDEPHDLGRLLYVFTSEEFLPWGLSSVCQFVQAPGRAEVSAGPQPSQVEVTLHSVQVSDVDKAVNLARLYGEVLRYTPSDYDPHAARTAPAPAEACTPDWGEQADEDCDADCECDDEPHEEPVYDYSEAQAHPGDRPPQGPKASETDADRKAAAMLLAGVTIGLGLLEALRRDEIPDLSPYLSKPSA